jgi:two-component system KDP operon response regulator KdpE
MQNGATPMVLIIDDEPQIRRLLALTLEANGYRTLSTDKGREGCVLAAQQRPALVLLDLGLPDVPGMEVLRRLREWSAVPIVILSVVDAEAEKVAALDLGADDFVTKPFHTGELLARLRVALRHAEKRPEEPVFRIGPLVVDLAERRVTVHSKPVPLTATEYALLRLFVRHAGKALTHRYILREVWGPGSEEQTHYLRVYMARLREKLEVEAGGPSLFTTESGVGYRLSAEI